MRKIAIFTDIHGSIEALKAIYNEIISPKGNHETYYTDLIRSGSTNVSSKELVHQKWVAKVLGDTYYDRINSFDYEITLEIEDVKIYFSTILLF